MKGDVRRLPAAALAGAAAAMLVAMLVAPPARAADGGLAIVAQTSYVAIPAEARVAVTIDAVATSFEPDTADAQIYYTGTTFAVPAGATNVAASSGGTPLRVRITEETDSYRAVEVTFGRGVFFQESYPYRVTFDLVDAGGAGNRDVRIGRSVLAFPVWAFGSEDEPGSSVRVELPDGYQPTVQGSPMSLGDDGVLSATPPDPFAFFAYVSADRPGAFVDTELDIALQEKRADIVVRAWEDDPAWGGQLADLLTRGLPVLETTIGVAYPHVGRLDIEEAAISRLGEYAGIYDPTAALIQVRYDADAFVVLHEAAHIWFNDRLFVGRWINEAWAEYYAVEVGREIGVTGFQWELTDELLAVQIPLNDWGAVGIENLEVEDFAYAASYALAVEIAGRTDAAALQRVWRAAADREVSYLPDGGAGASDRRATVGMPGWMRLLDLLEERTGASYADLWAAWVVNDDEEPLLAARANARAGYADLLEAADGWEVPPVIRVDLGDWRFDQARDAIGAAEAVLSQRDRIAARAAALDLEPSDRLQLAFEGDAELAEAATLAAAELAALDDLAMAAARLDDEPGWLERIGLLGSLPEAELAAAREAYEAGGFGDARRGAMAATATRDAAADTGRERVTLGGGLLLALDGLALSALSARRLRRRATLPVP